MSIQHAAELSAIQNEIESNVVEVKELHYCLVDKEDYTQSEENMADDLTHSQLVVESRKMIETLKQQVCKLAMFSRVT